MQSTEAAVSICGDDEHPLNQVRKDCLLLHLFATASQEQDASPLLLQKGPFEASTSVTLANVLPSVLVLWPITTRQRL